MTALKDRISAMIRASGPISVADYMRICLFDPADGYYTRRDPFGADGDFVTAPEISQMFGELVAAWLVAAWEASGRPPQPLFVEIGPGRGTMMRDMLRTVDRIDPGLLAMSDVVLVEASPRLAGVQRQALASSPGNPAWAATVNELPGRPLFVVGNELFDAIPARQFVFAGGAWRERMVALSTDGELRFAAGAPAAAPRQTGQRDSVPEGTIFEVAPAREGMLHHIASHIAAHGGAGLFFDYGSLQGGFGDTLQAVKAHEPVSVFDFPGDSDLTSHVDFAALADVARAHGLVPWLGTQREFLTATGMVQRSERLIAGTGPQKAAQIAAERDRLIGESEMGELFKVIAIAAPDLALYPFAAG